MIFFVTWLARLCPFQDTPIYDGDLVRQFDHPAGSSEAFFFGRTFGRDPADDLTQWHIPISKCRLIWWFWRAAARSNHPCSSARPQPDKKRTGKRCFPILWPAHQRIGIDCSFQTADYPGAQRPYLTARLREEYRGRQPDVCRLPYIQTMQGLSISLCNFSC